MREDWFIIGLGMVAMAFCANLFMFSFRILILAKALFVLGILICIGGLAMSSESEKPKKASWEEWLDDDFMKDDDEEPKTDN